MSDRFWDQLAASLPVVTFGAVVSALFAACLWYLIARPRVRWLAPAAGGSPTLRATIGTYVSLTKPRIIPLLLVPTGAAMLIADRVQPVPLPDLSRLLGLTLVGGILASAGAHVFNCYLDRDLDARMRRTRARPFPSGTVAPVPALAFGAVLTASSAVLLALTVNWLAATLALAGNLFYVFVYSLWLKRATPQNIVIGGAAGAVPPLVGWAALTGHVGLPAVLLFAIIFFWTPAHFWALALVREEDYKAAGIPMMPVVHGADATCVQILEYALLLAATSALLYCTQSMGTFYLVAALALGAVFVAKAVQLLHRRDTARAWGLFKYSNVYLVLLYAAMVVDRLLPH